MNKEYTNILNNIKKINFSNINFLDKNLNQQYTKSVLKNRLHLEKFYIIKLESSIKGENYEKK